MDIQRFLKLLKRYIWILILVPVVAAVITYFLSKNIPKEYKSQVQISTGLVDQSKQLSSQTQNDYFKTSQQFSNIIEKMKMRKIMSILSYNLIIHDLENPKAAFRKYSPKLDSLPAAQKSELLNTYKKRLAQKVPVTVYDNKGKFKLYDILQSMGYGEAALNKKMMIYRPDNSDFVNIDFTSEDPLLSAYVVNTLATEFISNYSIDVYNNQNNSIAVLDSLLKKKEREMNAKNGALKGFKMKNGVLNLNEQAATVYSQISQYEERKAQAIRDIQANQGALSAIKNKLRGVGDPYMGGTVVEDNNTILNLKSELKAANDRYIDNSFRQSDKRKIDSLQTLISRQSARNSDKNVVDPQIAKQGLIQQKNNLEISTEQIKNTISSIDKQLAKLKGQYNTMVPFDAGIQNYERDADIATKDYMAALERTNTSRTEQNTGLKLQVAQVGLPGSAEASKTIVYIALSGIATFAVCFSLLVLLFITDHSINTIHQLEAATKMRVLGSLNYIPEQVTDIKSIWNDTKNNNYTIHKDLLRSLRFEIGDEMAKEDSRVLGITSLGVGEGKTFLASNLAYAYAMTGKKVLLIGGDQVAPVLSDSKQLQISQNFETFLVKREIQIDDMITRLNKIDETRSLLEIQSERNLRAGFDVLKKQFDIIIIDVNSLLNINLAKEWLSFTEKNVAVFEAGKTLTGSDKDLIAFLKKQPGLMGWVINKIKLAGIDG